MYSTHRNIVATLHLTVGLLVIGATIYFWYAAAVFAPMFKGTFVVEFFETFGRVVAAILLGLASLEAFAAVSLFFGRTWPRVVLIGFGALFAACFPIGTALCAYTLWAMLRKPPLTYNRNVLASSGAVL